MLVPINLRSYVANIHTILSSYSYTYNLLQKLVTETAITVSSVREFHSLIDRFRKIAVHIYIFRPDLKSVARFKTGWPDLKWAIAHFKMGH